MCLLPHTNTYLLTLIIQLQNSIYALLFYLLSLPGAPPSLPRLHSENA